MNELTAHNAMPPRRMGLRPSRSSSTPNRGIMHAPGSAYMEIIKPSSIGESENSPAIKGSRGMTRGLPKDAKYARA